MLHVSQNIDQKFIDRLQQILEKNLENEHFGVSDLAMAANVSRSNLHRKVHAYNGNSTSQFIREYRLKKAMELLKKHDLTVAEIAYRVGFSSPTYFSSCFKDYYGYPPGEAKTIYQHTSAKNTSGARINNKYRALNSRWIIGLITALILIAVLSTSYYIRTDQSEDLMQTEYRAGEKTIAVLPLKNWSGDPNLEYIGDGMTDAVINRLTKISSISNVIPFTSVIQYKNSEKSVDKIADELGVNYILQGNFQLSGDQIKIKLQLIDGRSNAHFWSEEYQGSWNTDEVFLIQAEVVENVAERMHVEIAREDMNALNMNPTQNRQAYSYYLQANYQGFQYTKKGMENAVPLYAEAIRLDPEFYDAYINLAYLYLFGGASWGIYSEQEAWAKAKGLLIKAMEIDSTDRKVKGAFNDGLYIYEWDFANMEKSYKTASNLSVIYALQTGRPDQSLAIIEQGLKEQPFSMYYQVFRIQAYYFLDRKAEALEMLRNLDKLYSDDIMYLRIASRYYYYLGDVERSKSLLDELLNNFPDRPPVVLWLVAVHAKGEGNNELASQTLSELKTRFEEGMSGSPGWFIALYYGATQQNELALEWLQKSFDMHEAEMIWLREEPMLNQLRDDPRYLEIYHKVGFPMPANLPQ